MFESLYGNSPQIFAEFCVRRKDTQRNATQCGFTQRKRKTSQRNITVERTSVSHSAILAYNGLSFALRSNLRTYLLYHCSIGRFANVDAAHLYGSFHLPILL